MTKKGKIIGSIVACLFIAIMIPVAIFATEAKSTNSSSRISFKATDLEGNFYVALIGNKPESEPGDNDIGHINEGTNGTLITDPALLFKADYSSSANDFQVDQYYNGQVSSSVTKHIAKGEDIEIETPTLEFVSDGIDVDEINYYFIYVNRAEKTTEDTSRTCYLTASADIKNGKNSTNLSANWSYCKSTITTTETNIINATSFNFATWSTPTNEITGTNVQLDGYTTSTDTENVYEYAILRCTLSVDPERLNTEIDCEIELTVTIINQQE